MSDLLTRAIEFAFSAHSQQKRKYTGAPYIVHPLEVVGIVSGYALAQREVDPEVVMAVAVLHDVIEDCDVTEDQLLRSFGTLVGGGVWFLSDPPKVEGDNRASRKLAARERLSRAPGWVQSIKCGDCISNSIDIDLHDKTFAPVYRGEIRDLLSVLRLADSGLRARASLLAMRA